MIFNVPKLIKAGAWLELKDANKGAANWRGLRDPRGVVGLVAHHSVTNPKGNAMNEVEEVRYIHQNINGWGGIGYNIIITTENINGYAKAVLIGDLASIRAHTPNIKGSYGWKAGAGNWYLIGICMIGQLHKYNPTPEQIRTFKAIAEELIYNEDERFPALKDWGDLFSHKNFDATACSGNFDWQKDAILKADIGDSPSKPIPPKDSDKTPILISINSGDGYSHIAKRAGWNFWDDQNKVIGELKRLNPNHPSFARGNKLWTSDPAFIVGYKEVPKPTPKPEPKPEPIIEYWVRGETDEEVFYEKKYETLELGEKSYSLLKETVLETIGNYKMDMKIRLSKVSENQGEVIKEEIIEYEPVSEPVDVYKLVITYPDGKQEVRDNLNESYAVLTFKNLPQFMKPNEKVELYRNNILINSYKKPMENVNHKTVGEHLKSTANYAAPVQTFATAFGVILAYNNPTMPVEVVFAYTGLVAFGFNILMVAVIKILDKIEKA